MARPSLALRRRGQIGIQQFLQFRTRIPNRSGTGTRQGNGCVCAHRSGVGLAGDLYVRYRRQIADHGATVAVAFLARTTDLRIEEIDLLGGKKSALIVPCLSGGASSFSPLSPSVWLFSCSSYLCISGNTPCFIIRGRTTPVTRTRCRTMAQSSILRRSPANKLHFICPPNRPTDCRSESGSSFVATVR